LFVFMRLNRCAYRVDGRRRAKSRGETDKSGLYKVI
jgi:hypothetical protein